MKDDRLDLGRYIQNPFNRQGSVARQLNFRDLFEAKPSTGDPPWTPSRFTADHLTRSIQARKETLNPRLRFTPNTPFFDDNNELPSEKYVMFEGLGRFDRPTSYDFDEGRALTQNRPQKQPDYDPEWIQAYNISPTLNPAKRIKNPMPRLRNPDPNGYLMQMAEKRAEGEASDSPSIAQLLDRKGVMKELPQEEKQGEQTAEEQSVETNVSPGKTT